ncbi:MAG: hypothetical protein R6W68_05255 [Ignavibacteriaceae bacterium]
MKFLTGRFLIMLFIAYHIPGCDEGKINSFQFNGSKLSSFINSYLNNDSTDAAMIEIIFNNIDPGLIEVNNLTIDSLVLSESEVLYTMLLESSNPAFNTFAVMDRNMNILLKDNSLNGNINSGFQFINNTHFFITVESFKSRDTFNLQRTSLYEMNPSSVKLRFRSITGFSFGAIDISSSIISFTQQELILNYTVNDDRTFRHKNDKFTYDSFSEEYISTADHLKNFALIQIASYDNRLDITEITDAISFRKIVSGDEIDNKNEFISNSEFTISLSEDWREFKNFTFTKYLSTELTGSKFRNEKLGVSISILKLPADNPAGNYLEYELTNSDTYSHPIRYSDKMESGRLLIQFYEYTCGTIKFLLILEAPKYTYEHNSEIYENILNSFKINC